MGPFERANGRERRGDAPPSLGSSGSIVYDCGLRADKWEIPDGNTVTDWACNYLLAEGDLASSGTMESHRFKSVANQRYDVVEFEWTGVSYGTYRINQSGLLVYIAG